MSNSAVFIKLKNPNSYEINKIVKEAFGEYEEINTSWKNGFDFHNSENIILSVHENGIRIQNANFVNDVLVKRDPQTIKKIYGLFNSPQLILSYMHYDSGDSFGFCSIEEGKVKRFRYSLSTDFVTHDFGTPYDEELDILNGAIYFVEDEYGDREYLYKRIDDTENPKSYHLINSELTNEVMKSKIGFGLYDENLKTQNFYTTLKTKEQYKGVKDDIKNRKGFLRNLFGK